MSFETENRFAFDGELTAPTVSNPVRRLTTEQMDKALYFAREVSYRWDIATDQLTWSANTRDVLGFDMQDVQTGKQFATLMDSENFFSRYDTVLRSTHQDGGNGVTFAIEYRMKPNAALGTTNMWIEDTGRWFANQDGSPAEVLGIMRVADERHMRDQQMNFLSNCDPLTGMMNRARLTEALGESIAVATTDKMPCAFAILAVNNLDVMNEAYGFEVADEVIVALGKRLRHVMRMGDGIARYSGSKFAIILNSCRPEELNAALERFMRAVRDSVIETRLGPVWALLSIGAVSLPALGDDANTAIAHAEEALSEAFRLPGDGHVIYTSSEERKARRLLNARCATEIVNCLRDGLFKLAFQPVFDAQTREPLFHEALLRMADTTGALITAGHLVPIAERLGLIRLIDRAVLQLALNTLETYPSAKLSINISATTVTDQRWNAQLLDMIAGAPEPASRLIVEITETAALGNLATSKAFVMSLRELGCGVALDDFGAGYTSYRNLKELSISHIKLDGSFCCDLDEGTENRTFVDSMVALAHAFGLKVIAEWVDTPEDARILEAIGVDFLQGNMLAPASITAPWTETRVAAFQMEAASLAPVDASHFEHSVPDIADPHGSLMSDAATHEAAPLVESEQVATTAHPISLTEVTLPGDAELDAEIERMQEPMEDADPMMNLHAPADAGLVQPSQVPDAPATAATTAEVDDQLHLLRAALAELTSALGVAPPESERQAS